MQSYRKPKIAWMGLCLSALIAIATGITLRSSEYPGITHARQVPGSMGALRLLGPTWCSGHEILVSNGSSNNIIDIYTGAQEAIHVLGKHGAFMYVDMAQVSPDGRRLLSAEGTSADPNWSVFALHGYESVERPQCLTRENGPNCAWLPDSNRWVELVQINSMPHAIIYSCDTPEIKDVALSLPFVPGEIVRITPDGNLVTNAPGTAGRGAINFMEFPLRHGTVPIRYYSLPRPKLPALGLIDNSEFAFSRDGKYVAWILTTFRMTRIMDRLLSMLPIRAQVTGHKFHSVWIGLSDGTNLHEVEPEFMSDTGPCSLEWSPDNKHVSFYFDNAVWTVPAN